MSRVSLVMAFTLSAALAGGCIDASTQKPCVEPSNTGALAPAPAAADAPATASAGAALKLCSGPARPAADGMIEDFEDGNTQLTAKGGRDGYWWTAKDEKGSTLEPAKFAPVDGGGAGSKKAAHVTGTTASADGAWGASLGANFMSEKSPYDASKYAGISFKAKASASSGKKVRFKVGDVNTHQDAGLCKTCWNHFGKDLTLTTEWQEYKVLFAELEQGDGWGDPRPQNVSVDKLWSLDVSVPTNTPFDIWIDDVQFLECP